MSAPLCIDCRWFKKDLFQGAQLGRCRNPAVQRNVEISPVDGKPKTDFDEAPFASVERMYQVPGECGISAALFEPKTRRARPGVRSVLFRWLPYL